MAKLRSLLLAIGSLMIITWSGLRVYHALDAPWPRTMFASPESSPQSPERNFTEIEPCLYMGGYLANPPCGCDAVLNLCEIEDGYTTAHHRWTPIADAAPAPDIKWLRDNVDFVAEQQRLNRSTYVHCAAGISRSAMVVAAYLMEKNNWSRDQALEYMRKSRPIVRPNPAFMDLLKEWESR